MRAVPHLSTPPYTCNTYSSTAWQRPASFFRLLLYSRNSFPSDLPQYDWLIFRNISRFQYTYKSVNLTVNCPSETHRRIKIFQVTCVSRQFFIQFGAFCAAERPPVRLPAATQRCQRPGLIDHFMFNHNIIMLCHSLKQRVG